MIKPPPALRPYDLARIRQYLVKRSPRGVTSSEANAWGLGGRHARAVAVRAYMESLVASGLVEARSSRTRNGIELRLYFATPALMATVGKEVAP